MLNYNYLSRGSTDYNKVFSVMLEGTNKRIYNIMLIYSYLSMG